MSKLLNINSLNRCFRSKWLMLGLRVLGMLLGVINTYGIGTGPENRYFLVHDYRDDWQVYDERYKAYVPYIRERHQNYNSYSLFLSLEDTKGYHFLYQSKQEGYLFINAALQRKIAPNEWVVLSSDSLAKIYRKTEVFLTFYGSDSRLEDKIAVVGNRILAGQKNQILTESELSALPRSLSAFDDFFVLTGLFLLVFYAYLMRVQLRAFSRFFNVRDLITISKRADSAIDRPFDSSNFLFVIHLSLVLSYLYMVVSSKQVLVFDNTAFTEDNQTLLELLYTYLKTSLLILVAFLIKYVGISLLGQLYKLEKIVNTHFFKIIQSSSLFFLVLTGVLVGVYFHAVRFSNLALNILLGTIIVFFVVRLVLLYFTINKLSSLKNLYLFSYLCIAELIPLVVGIRFAL